MDQLGIAVNAVSYTHLDVYKRQVQLHACGKFISIRNSNECSYNIIMSTEIIGLSHLEREIIANVVRYNIRDFDYDKVHLETTAHLEDHSGFSRNSITILIAKLTAILRLANSMDRRDVYKRQIVEGSYSQHPYFGPVWDLRFFCGISEEEQISRIRLRNGEAMLERFKNEWIPKENEYFAAFSIREKSIAASE